MSTTWIARYSNLANYVARWSKDPSTKVGAVIVDERKRIVSVGFNGPPMNTIEVENMTRERRLMRTIHAEENAIMFANRDLQNCAMYVSLLPCSHCAAIIIQSGIQTVYFNVNNTTNDIIDRWETSFNESAKLFNEAKVTLLPVFLDEENEQT